MMTEAHYQLLYHEDDLGDKDRRPGRVYACVRLEKWWGPTEPRYIVTAGYKILNQYGDGWADTPPRELLPLADDAPAIRKAIAMYDQLKAAIHVPDKG